MTAATPATPTEIPITIVAMRERPDDTEAVATAAVVVCED